MILQNMPRRPGAIDLVHGANHVLFLLFLSTNQSRDQAQGLQEIRLAPLMY